MWPKMLFELLPHFARLLPMADKYLSTRTASEKAQEAALAALAVELRGELGRGTDAQRGMPRQMQDQSAQIGEVALDVARSRIVVEAIETRLGKLEQTLEARIAKLERSAIVTVRVTVVLLGLMALMLALSAIIVATLFRR